MLAIGADGFDSLLNGAYAVDEHVRTAPLNKNIPVIMGLLGWWYNQFLKPAHMQSYPMISTWRNFLPISSRLIWKAMESE